MHIDTVAQQATRQQVTAARLGAVARSEHRNITQREPNTVIMNQQGENKPRTGWGVASWGNPSFHQAAQRRRPVRNVLHCGAVLHMQYSQPYRLAVTSCKLHRWA